MFLYSTEYFSFSVSLDVKNPYGDRIEESKVIFVIIYFCSFGLFSYAYLLNVIETDRYNEYFKVFLL